ncbi:MAG: ArsR family transcriptional regulator [Candidatus Melainabacteria bacterium HGW-Melainabacteria-1]|nr:MAG: ArsR family transcriptional regulator [Candidatus Melainabacteria bacterium HGW-Melainabacteria-1]
MSAADIERIAKALADPHRLRILEALREQQSVVCGELQDLLALSQPTVSHHVKILAQSGVIETRKDGRTLRLTLNIVTLRAFSDHLQRWTF